MLTGYTDTFSVEPGSAIKFMVSSSVGPYEASLVRLIHGDRNPAGPGFRQQELRTAIDGTYEGAMQDTRPGSYGRVDGISVPTPAFSLSAWIYPTTIDWRQPQCVLSLDGEEGAGVALEIRAGRLCLCAGEGQAIALESDLMDRTWYFVYAGVDDDGSAEVEARSVAWPTFHGSGSGRFAAPSAAGELHLSVAAARSPGGSSARSFYNGKIAEPRLYRRVLAESERGDLAGAASGLEVGADALVGAWNLSSDPGRAEFVDRLGRGPAGELVNQPAAAMTDHSWRDEQDWRCAPDRFRAVHFHADDLVDAGWSPGFSWEVPGDLPSGVYAARLRAGGEEDHIPFFVRPRRGAPTAEVGVLMPTFTYLAYANERVRRSKEGFEELKNFAGDFSDPREEEWAEFPEFGISLYDTHADGSGCCYASARRPILNIRPDYRMWSTGAPRGLGADLHLIDWLTEKGHRHDTFTDGDLHDEGLELLRGYRVVITGSHPEYWSAQMLDALRAYLDSGGRVMYLGGNGFYWVTSVAAEAPHLIEVRRGYAGTRVWESEPGEYHHSTTGERGGLWRFRGRSPNALVGIGFAAEGVSPPSPGYRRRDRTSAIAGVIFDGVDEDPFGTYGLIMDGAAGDEIDRADARLGTPRHTLVLASSTGHDDKYQLVCEDILVTAPGLGGRENPDVRSDITFTETANDGAVFAAGAITWCGSLSHNGYDNAVSRITENVLEAFLTRTSWPDAVRST
ncbi:MAG: N,N-dimethylformamidase [Actinobacteria bacterium]|nr:N,N-dimethylformamidase [Actinomycetota bacterium]